MTEVAWAQGMTATGVQLTSSVAASSSIEAMVTFGATADPAPAKWLTTGATTIPDPSRSTLGVSPASRREGGGKEEEEEEEEGEEEGGREKGGIGRKKQALAKCTSLRECLTIVEREASTI